MTIRISLGYALISGFLVVAICAAYTPGRAVNDETLPSTYVPSGSTMYKQYCAACHGSDGMGDGPSAALLKTPPPDLTTLAKRHGGKFPADYVANILKYGTGPSEHGSSDMPTWGPIFRYINGQNEKVVQRRIKNLSDYLVSLQQK
jgi:mono/diheme cytochrome c family protein